MNRDNPEAGEELASARALAAEYQTKVKEAVALITRVRHEINNPLAALLGQAQLLLREDLSESARKRVETIESLAIRIRDTVGELRTVQTPVTVVNKSEQP
jgi:signal transduction histidine kinase